MCLIVRCGNFPVVFIKRLQKSLLWVNFKKETFWRTVLGLIVTKQNKLAFYVHPFFFFIFRFLKGNHKNQNPFPDCWQSILLKNMKRFFIKKCTPQKEPNFHYHTNGLTWKIKQRDFHQKSHTCRLPNKVFSTRFYFVKKGGKESKNQHVQRPPDETDDNLPIAAIRQWSLFLPAT